MTAINTGRWVYSLDGLSLDTWAVVAQSEYRMEDGSLIWMWPDWSLSERLAFDKAFMDGKVVKITGPAKQPRAEYWLYAKLAKYPRRIAPSRVFGAGVAGRFVHRALPEFA